MGRRKEADSLNLLSLAVLFWLVFALPSFLFLYMGEGQDGREIKANTELAVVSVLTPGACE